MRKWLLGLAAVVGLGTALVVWFAAEDARQGAILDARVQAASDRCSQTRLRAAGLRQRGAPAEEVSQAEMEGEEAAEEWDSLLVEQARRQEACARLLREVRRRTGW